jgi:ABC-type transport system involved in Fe-S cluster assembly fused permease/ATPase subunit
MNEVSKGRTTIIVAHRLASIMDADQIYVLGIDGSIQEHGTHAGLLNKGGEYSRMWKKQQESV